MSYNFMKIAILGIQRDNLSLPEYKVAMCEVEELGQQAEALDGQNEELEKRNDEYSL